MIVAFGIQLKREVKKSVQKLLNCFGHLSALVWLQFNSSNLYLLQVMLWMSIVAGQGFLYHFHYVTQKYKTESFKIIAILTVLTIIKMIKGIWQVDTPVFESCQDQKMLNHGGRYDETSKLRLTPTSR